MKKTSKTGTIHRNRIISLTIIIFLFQIIIVARYAYIQIIWSPQLQKLAKDQWTNNTPISAKRGRIFDINMNPLALSGDVVRIDAFLKDINKAKNKISLESISEKLSIILNVKKEDLLVKLNAKSKGGIPKLNVVLARNIDKEMGIKIKALKLPGIIVSDDTNRYYPNGNFLAQVLGSINADNDGRSGLELQYNSDLKGISGRFMGETDRHDKELPFNISKYIPSQNGNDLVLTIDQSIQYFTEKALEKGLVDHRAKGMSAIVMNPKTGEILAMANKPDYDPNNPITGNLQTSINSWKNSNVNRNFEMGSVLKVITAAAALEEDVVSDSDRFDCKGFMKVSGKIIHCAKTTGHGEQTFQQILQNSCNVGFMMLGDKLKKSNLYKYYYAFGLNKRTGIDLPGEENGILLPIEKVGPVDLATEAFGQNISVTSIQYITALSTIANDGVMIKPHLVKRILHTDENGNTSIVKDFTPKVIKKVISVNTAKQLRIMLESVVTSGVALGAYIPGYHVGGKTGTAQIPKTNGPGYQKSKYNSSFACMLPANNPQLVVLVSIEEPDPSNYYAGSTAAPLTKSILEDLIRYLHIQSN